MRSRKFGRADETRLNCGTCDATQSPARGLLCFRGETSFPFENGRAESMNVLVIDVGGSHVKLSVSDVDETRRFDSGAELTPDAMLQAVDEHTADWEYDVVSVGIPARVGPHGVLAEPGNLGSGWVGYDFNLAFGKPVRLVNDAAMQALGGYEGGRMLFLGLGTGVGSALIVDRVIVPLELGNLPLGCEQTLFERLGKQGLERDGRPAWEAAVHEVVAALMPAFAADYVMLGGGQVEVLRELPAGARRGGNADAITGGFRLWEEWIEPHDRTPSGAYRVVV